MKKAAPALLPQSHECAILAIGTYELGLHGEIGFIKTRGKIKAAFKTGEVILINEGKIEQFHLLAESGGTPWRLCARLDGYNPKINSAKDITKALEERNRARAEYLLARSETFGEMQTIKENSVEFYSLNIKNIDICPVVLRAAKIKSLTSKNKVWWIYTSLITLTITIILAKETELLTLALAVISYGLLKDEPNHWSIAQDSLARALEKPVALKIKEMETEK